MLASRPSTFMRTLAPASSRIEVGVLDQYPDSPGTTPSRTWPSGQRGAGFDGSEVPTNRGGAALSFFPLASVTTLAFACLLPSRASDASIVTTSPIWIDP